MKTQIIQLNPNDDYIAVRDKMNWSQTGRILLVWPDQGHVLNRQLDLNLVKHHATTMGAQLALATHDPEIRSIASQIGIPVFNSPRRALDTLWLVSRDIPLSLRHKPQLPSLDDLRKIIHPNSSAWMDRPVTRFICIGVCVLAIFAVGIFILPGAKINLSPQVETQSMIFDLYADPSSTSINLSTGSLPTYIQEVIVEGRDTMTVTGSVTIPDEPAVGSLRFKNISNQKINIPPGTMVTSIGSEPVRFITSSIDEVTVIPGQSIVLTARAIKPGISGNLPPDHLVVIEGELGMGLTVTNPFATYGGTDASVPSPTKLDMQSLRDRMIGKLIQASITKFQSILPAEDTLITPTISIVETLTESYFPSFGEPGTQLKLSMGLRIQSHVVSADIIHSLVDPIMNSNTPTGYSPLLNTLRIIRKSNPTLAADGKCKWTIRAERKLQVDIAVNQAENIIKGATVAKAAEILSASLPLTEPAQIELAPSWWPRLPLLAMRMEIVQSGIR